MPTSRFIKSSGNLLEGKHDLILNPVNCEGYAGKGLAPQIFKANPLARGFYRAQCKNGYLTPGFPIITKGNHEYDICLFPTKNGCWKPSCEIWIERGLAWLCQKLNDDRGHYTDIGIPALGCGEGGLDWRSQVAPLIVEYLSALPMQITLYPPQKPPSRAHKKHLREDLFVV